MASTGLDPEIESAKSKNFLWRFVAGLNSFFNPGHAWTRYSDKPDNSLLNKVTGSALTGAEQEANAFSASEAQKQSPYSEGSCQACRNTSSRRGQD